MLQNTLTAQYHVNRSYRLALLTDLIYNLSR